jgi:fatty acid desaturase
VVVCCLALLLAPLAVEFSPAAMAVRLPAIALLCFVASIVNHNHMHAPMFRHHALNVALNILLSLARGHSATGIVVPHNLNHHVHEGSGEDWIAPHFAGRGPGVLRLARYIAVASANMAVRRWAASAPTLPRRWRASALLEKAALWLLVLATLFFAGWKGLLLILVLPWLAGLAMLVGVNLLQHEGVREGSRDFTGPLTNWLLFNNGYHTVHHLFPALHWSRLPGKHRETAPRAHEERSLLRYLARMTVGGAIR